MRVRFLKQPIMNRVMYSLLIITLFSIYLFGWRVLLVLFVSNLFSFFTELIFVQSQKNKKVSTAVFVTGTLLALTLPPTIPLWIVAVGAIVAISFGKMVFGGFGMNIFNPAIVGRTFVYVSFPRALTVSWVNPIAGKWGGLSAYMSSSITSATPLLNEKSSDIIYSFRDLFIGKIPGSIGETSVLLIILCALYLIITKTARWQPMIATIISILITTSIFYNDNIVHLLFSGGVLFGSVFMVTDPITLPRRASLQWIYGFIVGFLTVFIRKFSLFTEGFMFALLISNTFMPIIEILHKKFLTVTYKPKRI